MPQYSSVPGIANIPLAISVRITFGSQFIQTLVSIYHGLILEIKVCFSQKEQSGMP